MNILRGVIAVSVAAFVSACASPGMADRHGRHHPDAGEPVAMAAMEPRMKAMQEMHQKMASARSPEERQALMADHMKAMQGGMAMMKDMAAIQGMGGMASGKPMPPDMARRHQLMTQHMETMQMMMDMMMDRMPAGPPAK